MDAWIDGEMDGWTDEGMDSIIYNNDWLLTKMEKKIAAFAAFKRENVSRLISQN